MAENTHSAIVLDTNLLARDGVTIDEATAASYIPATMPLTNVLDEEPSKRGRITTLDPSMTFFEIQTSAASDFDLFAIVNHNMFPGSQVRFFGAANNVPSSIRLAPTSIEDDGGAVIGALANIDEDPISPDGSVLQFAHEQINPCHARIRFATPASAPIAGDDEQLFVLALKSGTAVRGCQVVCTLYQNGVDQGVSWGSDPQIIVTDTNVHYLLLPWNAAVLDTASGAAVELLIETQGARDSVLHLDAIAWDSLQSSPTASNMDSGWLDVPEVASPASGPRPTKSFHWRLSAAWSTRYLYVQFRAGTSAQVPADVTFDESHTPDLFLDVGVIAAGLATELSMRSKSLKTGVETNTRSKETDAGNSFGADAFSKRKASCDFILTRAQLDDLTDRLDWRKGKASPFYIALEPGLTLAEQRRTAFWATLARAGDEEILDGYHGGLTTYRKPYSFAEKL